MILVLTSGCLLLALLTCRHQIRTTHFITWYSLPCFLFLYLHCLTTFYFSDSVYLFPLKNWLTSLYFSPHHNFSFSSPFPRFKLFLFNIFILCFHGPQTFFELSSLFFFLFFSYKSFYCINYIYTVFPTKPKSFFF